MSATVTGFDGAVIGRVTRHREPAPGDPALGHDLIVVSVAGDLDADTGPLLHITLTQALQPRARVCCDLSRVTFFGADGANVIVAAHVYATATGSRFCLRGLHGMTRRVLAITRLDETLTFA
jgi:anti-anti-sigma factor